MVAKSWLLTAICIFLTVCSSELTTAQTRQELPTSIPDLSGYDTETRELMRLACASQNTRGPVAYGACLNRQIASLNNSPGIPNLRGYDDETRELMQLACASQSVRGPVAYGACLNRQIASLQQALGGPKLTGFDTETRQTTARRGRYMEVRSDAHDSVVQADASRPGYSDKIRRRVHPNIVWSGETSGLETEISVRCSPSGTLLSAQISRSSGNSSWDDAALRAVQRSDPMPVDTDGKVPESFTIALRPAG